MEIILFSLYILQLLISKETRTNLVIILEHNLIAMLNTITLLLRVTVLS